MGPGDDESNPDILARLTHLEEVVRSMDSEMGEKASREQVEALEHKINDTRLELRREITRLAQTSADGQLKLEQSVSKLGQSVSRLAEGQAELKTMMQQVINQQGG